MMRRQTVEQLLLVFRSFRERYAGGKPLHKAYQKAVRDAADRHGVTYQTVGDGCRRRLKLKEIHELYALLARWMEGDSEPLAKRLKAASDPSCYDDIAEFFRPSKIFVAAAAGPTSASTSPDRFDTFSFRLPQHDSRMLRALAEIEGVSPPELLSAMMGGVVAERMKHLARAVLHESKAPEGGDIGHDDILKIVRDHEAAPRDRGAKHGSGSAARGDSEPVSDVDRAVRPKSRSSQWGFD